MNYNTNHVLPENTGSLGNNNPTTNQIENLYTTSMCLGPVARPCLETVPAEVMTGGESVVDCEEADLGVGRLVLGYQG